MAGLLTDVVNGAEDGSASKTLKGIRIVSQFARQKLERDEWMRADVLSLENHTHASATKLPADAVVRHGPAT